MTLAAFADLAEVIGAFGVIAGLIFVGVQLQQNTLQLRRAERNTSNAEASVLRQSIANNCEIAELMAACVGEARSFSPAEMQRINAMFFEMGYLATQLWDRTKHGLFPPDEFDRAMPALAPYLTSATGRAWWRIARGVFQADFVAALERTLPALTATVAPPEPAKEQIA
jgi:hypothetical protein